MGYIEIMNNTEILRFKTLIRERLQTLSAQSEMGRDGQAVVQLDQQSVGRLSRMDALQNQAMAKAQQARRDAETTGLKAALARIAEDDFGFCDACGDPIPPKRLELNLTATRCVSCASG